jgi:large subunit ribosomal protein L3
VSENNQDVQTSSNGTTLQLSGLFAFKEGMSTVYGENGEAIPVTVLRYEPWVVSQLKTDAKDGYSAIQLACRPKKAKNSSSAEVGHLKKAGFETGAQFVRELRVAVPANTAPGAVVSISSLSKGDVVNLTSTSKGKGFAGSIKRHGFGGGPATHGSHFHRQPGSSGNRTWPGRVMPGKRFPGHLGDKTVTVKNVEVVAVLPEQNVLMVRGPVPGARNSLVKMVRE